MPIWRLPSKSEGEGCGVGRRKGLSQENEQLVKMRQSFKRVENPLMEKSSLGSKGKMTEKVTSQ